MLKRLLLSLIGILCIGNALYAQEKPYLGAEIRSTETFLYGKFEVRMKTTEASGLIYGFFTFYDEPDFLTKWNEVDIEILGRYSNEIQFNSITGNHSMHEKRQVLPFNPHEDFHLYSFSWTPYYISWSVDSIEIYRQTGDFIKTMNRPQKLMMNVWPCSSIAWAGKIDAAKIPLQAEYDFVNFYSYEANRMDSFQLKWTDNFDYFDTDRWQKATHTFDTNECTFEPDNAVIEAGYLKLRLTKPIDDEIEKTPAQLIQSAVCIRDSPKKYTMYTAVKINFYKPINRVLYNPDYFSISQGIIKHVYFDIDRNYVIIYVEGLNDGQIKGKIISYKPIGGEAERHAQELIIK
jgi:beta-glucanase (GH16 family)